MGVTIEKTYDCPYINFTDEGELTIEGRSITEDPFSFWQPLLEWVEQYSSSPAPRTTIRVFLEYSNSSSNKYINELLRKCEAIPQNGGEVTVVWKYESGDESILQIGQDFESMIDLPFVFEEVSLEKEQAHKLKVRHKKSGAEAIITFKYWDAIVRNGHGDEYQIVQEFF